MRGDGGGIDKDVAEMFHDVGVHVSLPKFPPVTEFDLPDGAVAEPPVNTIIQHNGGKRHAPLAVRWVKSHNAGLARSGGTSKKRSTTAGAKEPTKHTSRWRKEMADPLHNQVAAFCVSSNLGKQIIAVIGYVLDGCSTFPWSSHRHGYKEICCESVRMQ